MSNSYWQPSILVVKNDFNKGRHDTSPSRGVKHFSKLLLGEVLKLMGQHKLDCCKNLEHWIKSLTHNE